MNGLDQMSLWTNPFSQSVPSRRQCYRMVYRLWGQITGLNSSITTSSLVCVLGHLTTLCLHAPIYKMERSWRSHESVFSRQEWEIFSLISGEKLFSATALATIIPEMQSLIISIFLYILWDMLRKSISLEIINKSEMSLLIFSSRSSMVLFFNFMYFLYLSFSWMKGVRWVIFHISTIHLNAIFIIY